METNNEDRWVFDRLASIEPHWSPNLARGRKLLDARLAARRPSRTWLVPAAAILTLWVLLVALPGTRALAQELWARFVLNRVDVARLDLSKLPLRMQVTTNGLEQPVQDVYEAERKAGFKPFLPSIEVLPTSPSITVTGRISVEQTIHVRDIESALVKAGASDVQVPGEWEGIPLRTEVGPMVELQYPNDVHVLEVQTIELSVPSDFDLEHFAEVAFRSIGVYPWEARVMAKRFSAHPAWLLDIPPDAVVNIHDVSLQAGSAILIEEVDHRGTVEQATVVRNTKKRMYSVSSPNRELSMKIADTLP